MMRSVLACVLALWALMFLLPVTAEAAETHEITAVAVEGEGRVELYTQRADAGQTVWLLAEPEEGYVAQIDGFCAVGAVRLSYAGLGMYTFTMPDGPVELQIRFVPAEGELYPITGSVADPALGQLILGRTEAREGEWVVVEVIPGDGCVLAGLRALGTDGLPVRGGYADTREGVLIYEYCLPDVGVVIEAEFAREVRTMPIGPACVLDRCPGRWAQELRLAVRY